MAITIIKDYSFSFAKNDDYVYLSSDKIDEQQFRYGLHFLYDKRNVTNVNNQIADGFIEFDSSTDFNSLYKEGDLVFYGRGTYANVPLLIKKIEVIDINTFKVYFDVNKLINDSYWYYSFLQGSSKNSPTNIYKCITKKVAANSDGYGVVSINDIVRELIEPDLLDNDSDDLTIDFSYIPFEEYLYKLRFEKTTSTSNQFNKFLTEDLVSGEDYATYGIGDYVIVEGSSESFYNGVQKCIGFSFDSLNNDWITTTDKPALKGTTVDTGFIYRADYEATSLIDVLLIRSHTAFYSGLKLKDIAGLSNVELDDLQYDYIDGNKYFSYAPKEQNTYLNDLGYLTLANIGDVTIEYKVTDSEGVEHIYELDFLDDGNSIFKIPSNPASINATTMTTNAARGLPVIRECDKKYELVTALVTDNVVFNIKKTTKFQNVRLLFSDLLGSLNGFNFALYSAKKFTTKKDTFTKNYQDFSNLNTIKFNNQSRGLTDLATFKTYKLVLNSDYLTQEESDYFEDLLSSNNVFAQYNGKVIAVNIPSKSVTIKDKIKGLIRYSLEVEFSISETQW